MKLSLEEEKKKLALKKLQIEAKEKRIKEKERKVRTRRLIELGGIVSKAGIEDLNNNTLLGALLEIKDKKDQESNLKKWRDRGATAFEQDKVKNGEPIVVYFDLEPPREAKEALKTFGLKWNRFRREWQGYAKKEALTEALKEFDATVEPVE